MAGIGKKPEPVSTERPKTNRIDAKVTPLKPENAKLQSIIADGSLKSAGAPTKGIALDVLATHTQETTASSVPTQQKHQTEAKSIVGKASTVTSDTTETGATSPQPLQATGMLPVGWYFALHYSDTGAKKTKRSTDKDDLNEEAPAQRPKLEVAIEPVSAPVKRRGRPPREKNDPSSIQSLQHGAAEATEAAKGPLNKPTILAKTKTRVESEDAASESDESESSSVSSDMGALKGKPIVHEIRQLARRGGINKRRRVWTVAHTRALYPGALVWYKFKSFPPWPAKVRATCFVLSTTLKLFFRSASLNITATTTSAFLEFSLLSSATRPGCHLVCRV